MSADAFVVAAKVEEAETVDHCSRHDLRQGPWVRGVVVDRHAPMLKQQRDHPVNLCGAVDPSGDVDLHSPSGGGLE